MAQLNERKSVIIEKLEICSHFRQTLSPITLIASDAIKSLYIQCSLLLNFTLLYYLNKQNFRRVAEMIITKIISRGKCL